MMVFNICHCQTQLQIEMCLIYFKGLIFNGPCVVPKPYAVVVLPWNTKEEFVNNLHTVHFP